MMYDDDIKNEVLNKVYHIDSLKDLNDLRIHYLGKQGVISRKLRLIKSLPEDERKDFGRAMNDIRDDIERAIDDKMCALNKVEIDRKLLNNRLDMSLPVRPEKIGCLHLISKTIHDIVEILKPLGFSIEQGPDIEDTYHVFDALNTPESHPARQMQDTFYLKRTQDGKNLVLRTHTSSVQIRVMENTAPPFRIIAPGRVYRNDCDATHTPMFHQIECLCVDANINMEHMKWCIEYLLRHIFDDDRKIRFRPSFFPFTEPSAEIDIMHHGKWLEVMGCGMVHPNVLKNVNVDTNKYQGFAFGLGVERIAMLKYNVQDLRMFFSNDIRWLSHYGFSIFDL